jgi:FkbM family methyltransferase
MRSFDPEVAETILRFAGDKDVFWDVGANKGTCAYRIAAALPTCRIVAIEPQRTMQELLQHNLGILASGRYEIFAVGIGEQGGQFSLFIEVANQGRATLIGMTDPHRSESVEIATAKTIADRSAFGWPTLVKIDVEGFEISVIRSLAEAFRTRAVRCCVFECHPAYERDYEEIKRLLADCGYYLYAIAKTSLSTSLVPAESLRRGSTDYAIVRDDLRS